MPGGALRLLADAVVTVDAEHTVHRPGALDIEGSVITWVGPAADAPAPAGAVRDVGGLLMPGMVNTHAHSPMTLLRSAGDGLPLARWLDEVVWPREAHMVPDDAYWGMLLGADEMLRNGITTTCEMYLHNDAVADAIIDSGMRAVITPGIFDLPGAGSAAFWHHLLDQAVSFYERYDGREGRLTAGLGPHSTYVLPEEGLVAVAEAAASLGLLVQIHLAETRAEGEAVRERYGTSAPKLLEGLGLLEGSVLAAHSVWLDNDDLAVLADHDVAVAHCPASNAKLGSGVARVPELLGLGVRVGLGTDGPASADGLELFEGMRLAARFARALAADPAAMTTHQALELATRSGAAALGLDVGVLEPGRQADVVRLELDDGSFTPALNASNLLGHLVWAATSRLVTDVWVGGDQVVAGGISPHIDASRVRSEVQRRARRIAEAAGH